MSIFYKIIVFSILVFCLAHAGDISKLIEDGYIVIDSENEQDYEDVILEFTDNPLLWKTVQGENIESLPINEFLKNALIYFHGKNKKVNSWMEFQKYTGFSDEEMAVVQLFFFLNESETVKVKIYNYTAMKIDNEPKIVRNSIRMKATLPSGWHFGGITERDLDERDLFDHYNFSVQSPTYFDKTEFLIGSFRFRWGNGLLFDSNPMKMISNSGSANLLKMGTGFRSYSGSDENNYLFGIANEFRFKHGRLYSFYSNHNIDCRLDNKRVSSLTNTGYHVSDIEVKYKNKLNSQTYGFASIYDIAKLKIGLLYYQQYYDYPIQDLNSFNKFSASSVLHELNISNLSINGEIASSSNRSLAFTETFHYRLKKLNLGVSYRYIETDFQSFYGSIQREFGGWLQNETGFYYYFGSRINESMTFSIFADYFQRIRPINDGEPIINGTNAGVYLKKRWKNRSYMELKLNRKSDGENIKSMLSIKVTQRIINGLYFYNRYLLSKVNYDSPTGYGQGFNSYLKYNIKTTSVTFGSTCYFSDYPDCRIYVYEPGIPMKFNMASLSGSGQNYFFTLEQKVNQSTTIYFAGKMQSKKQEDKYSLQLQLLVAL